MSFTEDLANMIYGDFSTVATIGNNPVKCIFNAPYKAVNMATGQLETTAPEAHCLAADVAAVKHKDTVIINGVTYKIKGIEPDGNGITVLILSKD